MHSHLDIGLYLMAKIYTKIEFELDNISRIKAPIIVGGANNQLGSDLVGKVLSQQGILYAPDYVVNAGGLINIVDELDVGGYNSTRVLENVKNIKKFLHQSIKYQQN